MSLSGAHEIAQKMTAYKKTFEENGQCRNGEGV